METTKVSFTAKDVMALRQKTGLGMMDCKSALAEKNGDMAAAEQWLRKKLKGKMEGRTARATAQGRIGIRVDGAAIAIVEIKSSLMDFRADRKWREYLDYCDRFFFAVPEGFPRDVLPEDCGLMVADGYGAAFLREAPLRQLNPARRRAQILRFAQTAAQRLIGFTDPGANGARGSR